MGWQEIVKKYDLGVSVIDLLDLEENNRIDPEYYLPEYLVPYRSELDCRPIGSILTKCQYGISQEMNEDGVGVEIYRMNELQDGFCKDSDLKFVDIDHKIEELYKLKPNDILFNRVNSIEFVGRTAIYKHKNKNRVFASYLIRLNTDESFVLPDYLNIFLNCNYGKNELKRKARWAVNQANINAEELKRIALPMASMVLQKTIREISERTHSLLGESKKRYKEAEQLLLKEINLEGYVPSEENTSVRELAECLADNRFDAEYWQVEFDAIQNMIRKNKNGFDTLDNFFEIDGEKIDIDLEKEYLYAELADVNGATGTIDNFTLLKGADLPSRGRMKLKRNDLIVSSVEGSLEKIALVSSDKENIVGSTGFFVLRAKEYEPEVALSLLKLTPIQKLLKRQAQGTILTAIPKSSLSRVLLPKINSSTQQKIKNMVSRSHMENQEAKELLEKAKRAVEIFIEKDEQTALNFLGQ